MRGKILKSMCLASGLAVVLMTAVMLWLGAVSDIRVPPYVLTAGVWVFAVCAFVSWVMSNRIVRPIRESHTSLDADPGYEELSPLLRQLESQRGKIRENMSELEEKESGLSAIMENMTEGIVLLDARAVIISINNGARSLLELPEGDFTGKHIFAVNQNPLLQAAVHAALGGTPGEETLEVGGGHRQIMTNPVWADGMVRGVVMLVLDVTEKQAAERMRREFSANVSHELKTPLTSISGYAEIIRDGLVKPEDIGRFAGNIYSEAARLINLIEDIMELSRLDENAGAFTVRGQVELYALSSEIAERLGSKARDYGVTVRVTGEETAVTGNRQLLDEMIYNLCENAIKYNKPGGEVEIKVEREALGENPALTVRDTGIGIPREHQGRVFERFYRVDKSHSKETGGTGLGLSIVKHGAIYHNAALELDSSPETGTAITIKF